MNHANRYPDSLLERVRLLQFRHDTTNVAIRPKNRPAEPPVEVRHDHSSVIPTLRPGVIHVLEWSDDGRLDRHHVDLF